MKTSVRKKTFDCVDMMHRAQARIQRELEGKSIDEKLAYWNQVPEQPRTTRKKAAPPPCRRAS